MKKAVILFFIYSVFNITSVHSQIQFDHDTVTAIGMSDVFDIYAEAEFQNNSTYDTFVWTRLTNFIPQTGWTSAVCDIFLCWPPTTDSAVFDLASSSTGPFSFHIYPANTPGEGFMYVCVEAKHNRNVKTCMFVNFDIDDAVGVTTLSKASQLIAYPNPATEVLHVFQLTNGNRSYRITDMSGKVIAHDVLSTNGTIDIAFLQKGVYSLEVLNGEHVSQTRFVK